MVEVGGEEIYRPIKGDCICMGGHFVENGLGEGRDHEDSEAVSISRCLEICETSADTGVVRVGCSCTQHLICRLPEQAPDQ
jgi:hypothetical protein